MGKISKNVGLDIRYTTIDAQEVDSKSWEEIQLVINNFPKVFIGFPRGLSLDKVRECIIEWQLGTKPIIVKQYSHCNQYKNENERLEELSNIDKIAICCSGYLSTQKNVFLTFFFQCVDYRELRKVIIKNRYPIPWEDKLLMNYVS